MPALSSSPETTCSPETTWHPVRPELLSGRGPTRILLVGCGGNGTAIVRSLVKLHRALVALGAAGLKVMLCDGADVSEANLARQPFAEADVGQNKAVVLANRLNISYDLRWEAAATHFRADSMQGARRCEVLISCVDTRKARFEISGASAQMRSLLYSMDVGNDRTTGQVALGTHGPCKVPLPTAEEMWPEIADPDLEENAGARSCSSAEALRRQDLFVHDVLASCASNLLWRLFRDGRLRHHGVFGNLQTGFVRPIPVPDPTS